MWMPIRSRAFASSWLARRKLSLTIALDSFQGAFSVFFDSVITGTPKQRGRLTAKALSESAFSFAYAFTGSLGFALTLPKENLLLGEPVYEQAMSALLETTRVKDGSELREQAKKLGVATVRAVYRWAETLANSGLGAELEWTTGKRTEAVVLQRPELENLRNVIGLTSDTTATIEHLSGTLFAIDTKRRTFGFVTGDAIPLRGSLSDNMQQTVEVPSQVSATIEASRTVRYSTEEEDIRYVLLTVERVKPNA